MKVVVTPPAFCKSEHLKSKLSSLFPNTVYNEKNDYLSESELIEFLKDADAAIIGRDPVTKTTLEVLPQLKMISKYGVGLDNLDIPSIKEKGVGLTVTAGTNKRSVAELTLSFMLGLCHRTFIGAERLKRGEWIREGGRDLSGKIIGVIGCGNVGKEVVHLLKPFGCVVLVCDIEDRSEFCRDQGVTESSFESLIEKSDIVTLHVPLTDLTRDMINEVIFRKMQANAYLINTSRGPVVNPSALHESLVSGGISGAALDVFCSEPPDDMGFLQLPNLMVTPHIGGNSVEAVEAMGQAAIDNLAEFFEK
ncbi:MAG TPA: phosphoglycerate dehydrogenase [Nitrospinae bacterium]|jgi:phosphoglycerate dehydrogenase-like enzyme|nr:phosphoglycerate dehydrogenase [Nitrospinota bacterium]